MTTDIKLLGKIATTEKMAEVALELPPSLEVLIFYKKLLNLTLVR